MAGVGQASSPETPREVQYGEQGQIDQQLAGAPIPKGQQPQMANVQPAPVPVPQQPSGPPQNLISVLPPEESTPAASPVQPQNEFQRMGTIILGVPGISPITRRLAAQLAGQFVRPGPAPVASAPAMAPELPSVAQSQQTPEPQGG
jgi:hypothetical protein